MTFETDAKHFPPDVLHLLRYQGRRMRAVLHETVPPDRKEALMIQQRVDAILDRRPRNHSVAPDGEIVWDNASSWVASQTMPAGMTVAVNETGEPEQVIPQVVEEPTSGGVGLLERPAKPKLTLQEEADIQKFSRQLGNLPEAGK